jgi:hypothetical protein
MSKLIATLVLATAVASTGCTYHRVGYGPPDANPPFATSEVDLLTDGLTNPKDPGVVRIFVNAAGPHVPVEDVVHAIHAAAARTLVILVHGCNNTYGEARRSYELARMLLPVKDVAVLEVYWDGGAGDPVALWRHARRQSKWAGLGLRRVLNRLDPATEVRVLSHSRGASVIVSALWNLPLREGVEEEKRFRAAQGVEAPPDLLRTRLAMIVPAMGEEDLEGCARNGLDGLIVGVNEDDPAVGKGPLPASWFGSTRLGAERGPFYTHAVPASRMASLVDFGGSLVHDFKDYLLRRPMREQVFPRLFVGDGYQLTSTPALTTAP